MRAPAINAGERRLPTGSRGLGWIRKTGAVLPVVVGSAGVEGIAGDELRGGLSFGSNVGLGYGGSGLRLRGWAAPHGREESHGGTSWTGGARVATEWDGGRRRLYWPEMGEMASHRRLLAVGALGGWHEVA